MRWWGAAAVGLIVACEDSPPDDLRNCYEVAPGETVTFRVPVDARTVVALQVTTDMLAIVSVDVVELTSACRRIADANEVSREDIAKADAADDADARVSAMCALARTNGPAPAPAVCTASASDRSDCLVTCAGCDAVCEMNARAKARCVGTDDVSQVAAIEAHLESLLPAFDSYTRAMSDIIVDLPAEKAACIPRVLAAIGEADRAAINGVDTAKSVLARQP